MLFDSICNHWWSLDPYDYQWFSDSISDHRWSSILYVFIDDPRFCICSSMIFNFVCNHRWSPILYAIIKDILIGVPSLLIFDSLCDHWWSTIPYVILVNIDSVCDDLRFYTQSLKIFDSVRHRFHKQSSKIFDSSCNHQCLILYAIRVYVQQVRLEIQHTSQPEASTLRTAQQLWFSDNFLTKHSSFLSLSQIVTFSAPKGKNWPW